MENKYYTPEIEEFHVGFEYQVEDLGDGGISRVWRNQIFDGEETRTYFTEELKNKEIRIKYLDKKDIESLGFIALHDLWYIEKHNIRYTLIPINKEFGEHKYEIRPSHPSNYFGGFYGKIKNISELRKLLKQLNIE